MKIRTGFVSNSSSSSFVVLTTKENHENVLKDMGKNGLLLAKSNIFQELHLFGRSMVSLSYMDGNDGNDWVDVIDNIAEDDEDLSEILDEYMDKVKNNKNECFCHAEDF